MKKVLSLVLAMLMVVSVVAGCTTLEKDPSDPEGKKYDKGAIIDMYLTTEIYNFDPQLSITDDAQLKIFRLIYEGLTTIDENGKIEFIAPLNAGEKTISVKLSSTSSFFVRRATLKTCGAVGYPDGECFVTVINEGLKSHVCYCYDGELLVKEYVETLLTMIQIQGVKCGTICKVGDLLAVFYIDLSGMLWGKYYTSDEYDLVRSCSVDQGVSSVCALSGEDEATLFSVKGGRVYRYTADKNFNLTTQITEYGARRVSCDPSLSGYIIITDFSGNGKIIKI